MIKNLFYYFRFYVWARFKLNTYPSYYSSHSQFGEDMILRSIFGNKRDGFYVDIGAHHPVYFSNTFHFYQKGWNGVNIDAAPGSMRLFNTLRHRDKNIEACIGIKENEPVDFFIFDKPAMNTFDKTMAKLAQNECKLLNIAQLKTRTLKSCLDEAVPAGTKIDFLSIDVEGMDETILRSNDWNKYSPSVILFEIHNVDLDHFKEHALVRYLLDLGYKIVGKSGPSFIAQLLK